MSRRSILLLTILFAIILSLSVSDSFNKSSFRPTQSLRPKTTQTPKPILLPLDIRKEIQTIKSFVSPTPALTPASIAEAPNESFESLNELQQSLNISLDLTGGGIPFGGKVLNGWGCDQYCGYLFCGPAYELIVVGPPVGGSFTLTNTTRIYREFDESVGNWVLGLTTQFDETCWQCAIDPFTLEPICLPNGGGPEIDIMGTSK